MENTKTSNSKLKLSLMKNSLETKEKKKDKKISPNDMMPYVLSFPTSNGLGFGACFLFVCFFPWVLYLFVCFLLFCLSVGLSFWINLKLPY